MGGRTAEIGWFRAKTELFHNDVSLLETAVGGDGKCVAAPRRIHSRIRSPS